MHDKELHKKIAEALGWTDLRWEEGYSRAVPRNPNDYHNLPIWETSPKGWRGKGPGSATYFHIDSVLLDAWHTRNFAVIRTILEVTEKWTNFR